MICVYSLDGCAKVGATNSVEHVEFGVESRGDQVELIESHHEAEEGHESSDVEKGKVPREDDHISFWLELNGWAIC